MSLVALTVVIVLAVIWSVVGSVPMQVRGEGILLRTGGMTQVVATSSGQVTGLTVRAGDMVQRGQRLGNVAQPELLARLEDARAERFAAREQETALEQFQRVDSEQQTALFRSQRDEATRTIAEATELGRWYAERIRAEQILVNQGYAVEDKLFEARRGALNEAARQETARKRLEEISIAEAAWRNRALQDRTEARLTTERTERVVIGLEQRLLATGAIVSLADGRVVEVLFAEGQLASAGAPILRLEPATGPLEALVYVPASEGKKIRPGMRVRIAPATVLPEEFGYIEGTVLSVSTFPASPDGMMRVLQNEALVSSLSASGTPFELFVQLARDTATVSGYRWTSGDGPALELFSGTPAIALITERAERPIVLVLPFLRRWLGR
jgi:HlyD family secretion protein